MRTTRKPAGRLVRLPAPHGRVTAFVPHELPPTIEYSPELAVCLSRADWALGAISSVAGYLPNPRLLFGPLLRVEAVLSSRIEGTRSTLEQVLRAEVVEERPDDDTREVLNYLKALELGAQRVAQTPAHLDLDLVRQLHRELLTGVRGHDRTPGRFREVTVWVGPHGRPIEYATYVPPPWESVVPLMEAWEAYVRSCVDDAPRVAAPALVQCALLHAQFEMIHPFIDGNGRVGRLLMTLFLIARRLIGHPVLLLSAYFERNRSEYYGHLLSVSSDADWEGWVGFFLQGVREQSEAALSTATTILDLRDQWRRRLDAEKAPAHLHRLVDHLLENPYTTPGRAAEQLGVSFPTAWRAVHRLQDLGLLEEITGRKRGQQFLARELLQAIEASAGPPVSPA